MIEDGDLASAASIPPTALNAFADLFSRLGPKRGVNYSIANNLYHMVKEAGFADPQIEIHQPAGCRDDNGVLLTWSVAEAGPAFVAEGLITRPELEAHSRRDGSSRGRSRCAGAGSAHVRGVGAEDHQVRQSDLPEHYRFLTSESVERGYSDPDQ